MDDFLENDGLQPHLNPAPPSAPEQLFSSQIVSVQQILAPRLFSVSSAVYLVLALRVSDLGSWAAFPSSLGPATPPPVRPVLPVLSDLVDCLLSQCCSALGRGQTLQAHRILSRFRRGMRQAGDGVLVPGK